MKYNYNLELDNIINNIYKEMIYQATINNNEIDFSDLNKSKNILLNEKVYLGNDMDSFIINSVPNGHEGNLFRVSIAKHHDRLHPRFENYKGEPVTDSSYNKFALLLWEEHMNNLLIEDVQNLFSQESFVNFVNNNLDNDINDLSNRIKEYKNNTISINFNNEVELLNGIITMLEKEELDFKYAHLLTDMDKLRDDMTKMAFSFDIYNEFDKLEDEIRYCLTNYCKYSSTDLLDALINDLGFELVNDNCIILKK